MRFSTNLFWLASYATELRNMTTIFLHLFLLKKDTLKITKVKTWTFLGRHAFTIYLELLKELSSETITTKGTHLLFSYSTFTIKVLGTLLKLASKKEWGLLLSNHWKNSIKFQKSINEPFNLIYMSESSELFYLPATGRECFLLRGNMAWFAAKKS